MTDKLRAAAQMALEALEWSWGGEPIGTMEIDAINALRAALSEPLALVCEAALKPAASEVSGSTPEPAGWALWIPGEATPRMYHTTENASRAAGNTWLEAYKGCMHVPLYAHPPAHPKRQPLTEDAERYRFLRQDFSPMGVNIDGNHAWAYRRNATLKGPNLDAAIDAAMEKS